MSRTCNARKKYEGRMRKLEKKERERQEELRKLAEIEEAKWKIGAKDKSKEEELERKLREKEEQRKARDLAYEQENSKYK